MTHTFLVLLSVVAAASRPAKIDIGEAGISLVPPISWSESTSTAFGIAKSFNASAKLPGQTEVGSGVRSWLAPAGSDGQPALHVQWIVGKQASDPTQIAAIARTLLDDTRERPHQADLKAFKLIGWQEARDGEVASGVLEHVNTELELRTLARTLVFVDGAGRFHEIRLECLMADGEWAKPEAGDGSPRAACESALASAAVLNPKKLTALGELPGAGTLRVTAEAEAPHAMQLETPEPGASLRAEGSSGGKVITEQPATSSPSGSESRTSRMILVVGGAAIIVALALTMGKKRRPSA